MDGGGKRDLVYANRRSRPYYDRRCKNKITLINLTNIDSLPDELVFLILLELHVEEIYESALFVCRKWYHMIRTHDFVHTHLRHSTPGLLIRWFCKENTDCPTLLTLRGGRIETFKSRYEFPGFYWNTCNGLILGLNPGDGFDLCIVNPATKQHFALPPSPEQGGAYLYSGIGYARASMEYKVARSNIRHGCALFTVGADRSWRNVDMQHISHTALGILYSIPLIIEGLVYWITQKGTSLLSLNLESEIITEIHIPQGYEYGEIGKYYLSTWSSLTLLVDSSSSGFSWDVWELKKPETGEWKKLPDIDLEAQKCRVEQLPYKKCLASKLYLKPVGWLNYGEVLVLCVSRPTKVCLLYNVVTQETDFLELDHSTDAAWFFSYKNSLVRLDRCS